MNTQLVTEREAARKAYSEAMKTHNRMKPWYESLIAPTEKETLAWLIVKDALSKTAKALHDIDTQIQSTTALTGQLVNTDVMSIINRFNQTKEKEDEITKFRKSIADNLEAGGTNARDTKAVIDMQISSTGKCLPAFNSLEEWEQFQIEHPIPTQEAIAQRLAVSTDKALSDAHAKEQSEASNEQ